jgi:hypothetical protein
MTIDVAMLSLNGIETVKRARQRWPSLRVFYVTGYVDMPAQSLKPPATRLSKSLSSSSISQTVSAGL